MSDQFMRLSRYKGLSPNHYLKKLHVFDIQALVTHTQMVPVS